MKKITIEELKNIKMEYKDKINITDNPFGIEIEFASAPFNIVRDNLEKVIGYDPVVVSWKYKTKKIEDRTQKWVLKNDSTVQDILNDLYRTKVGGEVNTPIMKNNKKYWKELNLICDTLSKTKDIEINGNCSVHIHTSKTIYKVIQEYKNLFKLIMLYEDIAYKIGYGETNTVRPLLTRYAKPLSFHIYKHLDELERMETEKDIIRFIRFDRKHSFNFRNIENIGKATIENRIGNPTLNKIIIQNYVLFNNNFLNYAKIENFDTEFIDYKIKQFEPIFLAESLHDKPDKAIELLDLITKNELDQLYLLKQYLKAFNEHDIEKTFHL